MSVQQSDLNDPALVTEVDLARAAAQEEAGDERVGEYVSWHVEDEAAVTHLFEADKPGYQGWRWAVTITSAGPSSDITVSEVVLLPGPSALVAPDWIPWQYRVQAGDLGVGDLLPTSPDDPRLVPAYLASDDPAVEEVATELGLGRVRVMSRPARLEAATRWQESDFGPRSDMARSAPAHCGTCGFYLPLAGALRASFGTCGNEISPADGHVVHTEYGCGAHSEAEVEQVSPVLVADLIYDDAQLDVEPFVVVDEVPAPASALPEPAEPAASAAVAEPAAAEAAAPAAVEPVVAASAEPAAPAAAAAEPAAATELAPPTAVSAEPAVSTAPSAETDLATEAAAGPIAAAEPAASAEPAPSATAEPLPPAVAAPSTAAEPVSPAVVAPSAGAEPASRVATEPAPPTAAEPVLPAVVAPSAAAEPASPVVTEPAPPTAAEPAASAAAESAAPAAAGSVASAEASAHTTAEAVPAWRRRPSAFPVEQDVSASTPSPLRRKREVPKGLGAWRLPRFGILVPRSLIRRKDSGPAEHD